MSAAPSRDETLRRAWAAAAAVCDPEIPVLTIADLGMLRAVRASGQGVEVVITPTYCGCPAMAAIEREIRRRLAEVGIDQVTITTALAPAWTTDWLTEAGRAKLLAAGIAPPVRSSTSKQGLFATDEVRCPRCGAVETERISAFGSTACKALYRCRACAEPFDYFKCL